MSRRKQGKPQQLRRDLPDDYMETESLITSIEDAEEEVQNLERIDMLKCGDCQQEFVLSDIVHFIEHKKHCYAKTESNFGSEEEYDDTEESCRINSRLRITNPMKKSPYSFSKDDLLPHSKDSHLEPSSYICSQCRHSFNSAWILLHHAQNIHHMKIYLENVDIYCEKTTFQHQQVENEHSLSSNLASLDHPPPLRPVANGAKGSMPPTSSSNDPSSSTAENSSLPFFVSGYKERSKLVLSASNKYFSSGSSLSYQMAIDQLDQETTAQRSSNFEVKSPKTTKAQLTNSDDDDDGEDDDDEKEEEEQLLEVEQHTAMDISRAEHTSPPATSSSATTKRALQASTEFCQLNAAERLRLLASQQPMAFSSKHLKQHRLFNMAPYLGAHASLRHQGKLKTCEFCGKQFKFQSNLIVHRRSHTGEKPYKCQLCDHACSQASKLKRHMKIHMNRSGRWAVKSQFRQTTSSSLIKISTDQLATASNSTSRNDSKGRDKEDQLQEKEREADGSSSPDVEYINTSEETAIKSPQTAFHSALNKVLTKSKLEINPYNQAYKQALAENKALNTPELNSEPSFENVGSDKSNCSDLQVLPTMVPIPSAHRAPSYQPKFPKEAEEKKEADSPAGALKVEPVSPTAAVNADKMYSHWILHPTTAKNSSVPSSSASDGSASSASNVPLSTLPTRKDVSMGGSGGGPLSLRLVKPVGESKKDTCEFCGKVFKNCSNLTVHRRSHTGEKPYKCELCSYACAQSSKLTRHMKTHGHGSKEIYRCEVCNMPFSVFSTLEKHMKKWHWEVLSSRYDGDGLGAPNAGP